MQSPSLILDQTLEHPKLLIKHSFGLKLASHLNKHQNIFLKAKHNSIISSERLVSPKPDKERVQDFVNPSMGDWAFNSSKGGPESQ